VSLLRRGNQTVTVFPMVEVPNPDGGTDWRPSTTGVPVRASVQPVGRAPSDELAVAGQTSTSVYRVRPARGETVPNGRWARVEWRGRAWDLVDEPAEHTGSPRTAHTTFRIRARTAQGV
jgi:hypothetical protein